MCNHFIYTQISFFQNIIFKLIVFTLTLGELNILLFFFFSKAIPDKGDIVADASSLLTKVYCSFKHFQFTDKLKNQI